MPTFNHLGPPLPIPQVTHRAFEEYESRHRHQQLTGVKTPSTPHLGRPQRLTRKEVRLVCSLLNQKDRDFLQVVLSHVRSDSIVARSVVRGICKYPQFLTKECACDLLDLLPLQDHRKYARNLAVAILMTDRFSSSFDVIARCARVITNSFDSLSPSQRRKVLVRATSYPDFPSKRVAFPFIKGESVEHHDQSKGRVDYAGAVSVLLIARFPKGSIKQSRLFDTAVRFSQRYPDAENLWLIPLREHSPNSLLTWQTFLHGRIPARELFNCVLWATATIIAPMMIFDAFKRVIAPPRPLPLGISITVAAATATFAAFQIVRSAVISIRKRAAMLDVCSPQREQVLEASPSKLNDSYGTTILRSITTPLERAILNGASRYSHNQID